jgi:amino acid adenylation domain-containing protein
MNSPSPTSTGACLFPASASQRGLWLLDKLDGPNPAYNVPATIRVRGKLATGVLMESLRDLATRHEVLRTAITDVDGEPRQLVHDEVRVDFVELSLDFENDIEPVLLLEAAKPFALGSAPLWRARVFHLSESNHVLQIVLHHGIADGYSLMVLMRDLMEFYNARREDRQPDLPGIEIQFGDYACWEESTFEVLPPDSLDYWKNKLANLPELGLPGKLPRPAEFSYSGKVLRTDLDGEMVAALEASALEAGLSPFIAYLGIIQIALLRWTGQNDIPLGVPVAGRTRPELKDTAGFLTNTLVVRHPVSTSGDFAGHCAQLAKGFKDDLEHSGLPFELLSREILEHRDASKNPLFQIMFAFQQEPGTLPAFAGTETSVIDLPLEIAHFDLHVEVLCRGDQRQLNVEFATDIVGEESVHNLISIIQSTLGQFASHPGASITGPPDRPADPGLALPLSPHQERIWFIDSFETGNVYPSHPVYHNMPVIIPGQSWQREVVLVAAERILQRHPALRAHIQMVANGPQLEIDGSSPLVLDTLENGSAAVDAYLCQPFDLENDRLFRMAIGRADDGSELLVMVTHHLLADRRSLHILSRDFIQTYQDTLAGKSSNIGPSRESLPRALQTEAENQAQAWDQDLNFWIAELELPLAALEIPADFLRHPVHLYEQGRHSLQLDAELMTQLRRLAESSKSSCEALLLSAFQVLMSRYSGQEEIVLGIPQPADSEVIAPLSNLLVCREQVSMQASFSKHLEKVQRHLLEMRKHGAVSFDRLVKAIDPPKDMSRTALFDVLFEYTTQAPVYTDLNTGYGKYDIHAHFSEAEKCLLIEISFNLKLYTPQTIERMFGHFQTLLESIVETPGEGIASLELLSADERKRQLQEWNDTEAAFPESATIHQLFEERVLHDPEKVAIRDEGEQSSYAELNALANRIAHHLLAIGIGTEELVGICMDRSAECVAAMLGVLKAGGAYLPLDPDFPKARLQWILADAGVRVVIGEEPSIDPLDVPLPVDIRTLGGAGEKDANPGVEVAASQLAYCIYTSGSTGKPKGVLVEHRQIVRLLVNDRSPFDFKATDVWTFFHSPCFDFSVWEMYGALLFGGTLVVVPKCVAGDSAQFADLLVEEEVSVLNQTPTSFYYLADEFVGKARPHHLHTVIFGGETLSPLKLKTFHQNHPEVRLVNMFGITETTVHVTYKELKGEDFQQNKNLVGRPIPTTTCYILDRQGKLLPPGVAGEICVGGLGVARGYLNRPELTNERFVGNPFAPGTRMYRSGDKGYAMGNGELVHLGRFDSQVQLRGYRVETGEIQACLLEHPDIKDAVITVRKLESDGVSTLIAYVALKGSVDLPDFKTFLSQSLPDYMIPSRFVIIDEIPLTPNGKADLDRLPDPTAASSAASSETVDVGGPLTQQIGGIWSDLLGVDCLGQEDDFFKLGGYSLLATRMLARLEQETGCKVPLRSLFENPSLGRFANHVANGYLASNDAEKTSATAQAAMSSTQKRLWFLDRLDKQSLAYHLFGVVDFDGSLDAGTLQQALQWVADKHPALRTGFPELHGEPHAQVADSVQVPLEVEDLSHLPPGQQQQAFKNHSEAFSRQPFDLTKPPLLRARLYQLSGDRAKLLIGLHHIIADGWSLSILFRDLQAAYDQLLAGTPPLADAKSPSYPSLPEISEERRSQLLAYWKPRLENIEALQLPTDFPRPALATAEGAPLGFSIDRRLTAKLKHFCHDRGHTPFMVCLAAFELLLSRKSRQTEFAVGIPLANRDLADLHSAVGCFVNTMPAPAVVDEEQTFAGLLERVRATTLAIQENQQLPFDQLVDALNPQRDLGSHPLYQVVFNYQEALFRESGHPFPRIEPVDTGASQVDLALYLDGQADSLEALLVYSSRLFTRTTIARLARQFEQTLESCLEDPGLPLKAQKLLTDGDRRLLAKWNHTGKKWDAPALLHQLFEASAAERPDRVAVSIGEKSMTYRELDRSANGLARKLLDESGLELGATVAVCSERSLEMVTILLAVLKAGGAYLPLDPKLPAERIERMLQISKARLIVASPDIAGQLASHSVETVVFGIADAPPLELPPPRNVSPPAPAYVIFTSGSTGEPKGVVNTHQAISNRLLWMRDYLAIDPQADKVLQKTPYTFDVSLWDIFLPLVCGAELVLARPGGHLDPSYLVEEINRRGITTLHFVPSMLQAFLLHPQAGSCGSLRHVVCSGEALPPALAAAFHKTLPDTNLYNLYGPTEAAVDVTAWKCIPGDPSSPVPIGHPIANLAIHIKDRFLRDVPPHDLGEICIEGLGLAEGYCNQRELTDAAFVRDPLDAKRRFYRTGDGGRFREDGAIEYHGRNDGQVKIRGLRVELEEIDHTLRSLPGIADAATVVPVGKQLLHSFFTIDPQAPANTSSDHIKAALKQQLPDYMVPTHLSQVESLPLSRHGKIDRKKLSHWKIPQAAAPGGFRGEWENLLADVWRELLDSEAFGRDDNFFDVGGHSLLLVKAHLEIEKRAEIRIDLVDLFQYPTIASLAAFLQTTSGKMPDKVETPAAVSTTDIAVIGMSGRFPGAATLEEFKELILAGEPAIRFFEREELLALGAEDKLLDDPNHVPAQGAMENVAAFDADYFSFSPAEAARLDPQARVFLTCAEEALQNAAIDPGRAGSVIGVFAGASLSSYGMLLLSDGASVHHSDDFSVILANDKDYLATRVAYKLGLKGPALSVQTACSTSLASVHLACQSLLQGECGVALAGGVSIQAGIPPGYIYQQDGILSPDGHCRAFSEDAAGTVQGSGCGVVVLKPLDQALTDGDPVLAVIKGSAMNNDGADKVGFTAPGVAGQRQVIQSALAKAGVAADAVSYIETHGTGTALGDMIEVSALKSAFAGSADHHCVLGAVKSQIGHLDAAAGVAGLIKTVLCLQEQKLPPTLYADRPNPKLGLDSSPFALNPKATPWLPESGGRTAGVSSFGIGGTNVHVVLQEAVPIDPPALPDEPSLVVLSAPTESALEKRRAWLLDVLANDPPLPSLAWTLQSGRREWPLRAAWLASTRDDLVEQVKGTPGADKGSSPSLGHLQEVRQAWLQGREVAWRDLYPSGVPRRLALPPFPFEYQNFWALGKQRPGQAQRPATSVLGSTGEALVYTRSFQPVTLQGGIEQTPCLVVGEVDGADLAEALDLPPRSSFLSTAAFLADSQPGNHGFGSAMIAVGQSDGGTIDSLCALLLSVQKQVATARDRGIDKLLLVATGKIVLGTGPWHNALESFVIVLRQEYPNLDIRMLRTESFDAESALVAKTLLAANTLPHPVLNYLGHTLLAPRFNILEPAAKRNPLLRKNGKYLITGAGGGIARQLSRHLAERCAATLYLGVRNGIEEGWGKELEKLGTQVKVLRMDVNDASHMNAAMAGIPELDGIFHLAGVSGDAALLPAGELEEQGIEHILAPKTRGTENLLALAETKACQFFVGFSSLSTVLGGLGFSVYAAANAAMDALLAGRHTKGDLACFSIGWDGWNLDGTSAAGQLDPDDAWRAMEDILATCQAGQFLVAATPLEPRLRNWVRMENGALDAKPQETPLDGAEAIRQALESIWRDLLGIDGIREGDSFSSLGGDSLLAVQMVAMISKRFPVDINIGDIMNAATVGQLAELLWEKRTSHQQERETGEI